jgi:NAD(P)-dependent dehydrogenase (short-subunit alcohol dehydrogenase family)
MVTKNLEDIMKIYNAVALVTGSNRGIGKALVAALDEAGAKKIYALARDIDKLDLNTRSAELIPIQGDIADVAAVERVAAEAKDVTLLFNNAGVLDFGNILDVPLESVIRNFETNFYGPLAMSRSFAPVIEANGGGAIVNTLTLLSLASMPGFAAYNASKAAAWSMTMSLRASLANRNIDVHGVFPGAVDTDMIADVEIPKTAAMDVAKAIVQGVNEGQEDIFPDPMSTSVYEAWSKDHKAVEKQFAQM